MQLGWRYCGGAPPSEPVRNVGFRGARQALHSDGIPNHDRTLAELHDRFLTQEAERAGDMDSSQPSGQTDLDLIKDGGGSFVPFRPSTQAADGKLP